MSAPEFPHASPDTLQREVAAASDKADAGDRSPDVKYSKDEVNYRDAGSSSTKCRGCKYFSWLKGGNSTGSCKLVAGRISPDAVCDKYRGGSGGLKDLITGK
jgi:hypothetical protein